MKPRIRYYRIDVCHKCEHNLEQYLVPPDCCPMCGYSDGKVGHLYFGKSVMIRRTSYPWWAFWKKATYEEVQDTPDGPITIPTLLDNEEEHELQSD